MSAYTITHCDVESHCEISTTYDESGLWWSNGLVPTQANYELAYKWWKERPTRKLYDLIK